MKNETQKIPWIPVSLIIMASVAAIVLLLEGCMTKTVITPGSGTNAPVTNTVVNQANLALDCAVIQANASILTSLVIQKDPAAVAPLKDAVTALTGVLTGASPNSTAQILGLIGQNNNPTIVSVLGPIVQQASSLEQNLLAKYGASVAGQISIAIVTAVDAGIAAGLVGK